MRALTHINPQMADMERDRVPPTEHDRDKPAEERPQSPVHVAAEAPADDEGSAHVLAVIPNQVILVRLRGCGVCGTCVSVSQSQ